MNSNLLKLIQPELFEAEIRQLCKEKKDELGFDIEKALYPTNPFLLNAPLIELEDAILLVEQWDLVRDSAWDSVFDSAWDSTWDSAWDSTWDSVFDSVFDSVRSSALDSVRSSVRSLVWGYYSSIYFGIEDWKYVEHEKGTNPFKPAIDLWEAGYVASHDGENWRLHVGADAEIVWCSNGEVK